MLCKYVQDVEWWKFGVWFTRGEDPLSRLVVCGCTACSMEYVRGKFSKIEKIKP